ncbi:MAG: phosphate signaling complex PhoU family protein, partial [Acetatifactor sp.]
MSPRVLFEQELELLKSKVAEMGERAEISYDKLVYAVRGNDRSTLTQLLDNDRQMIDMQRTIETMCLRLLTRQQPVARDLRLVSAALKVVTDIERVGDHVTDIAELYLRIEDIS